MNMNYYKTLIAVADDCPVTLAVVPSNGAGRKTVARIQYEMLASCPYVYNQEDVLFESWFQRQVLQGNDTAEITRLRQEFFAKPQACLRASPLPKKYGFGFVFDQKGKVALCKVESEEYRTLLHSEDIQVIKAMRSSRG